MDFYPELLKVSQLCDATWCVTLFSISDGIYSTWLFIITLQVIHGQNRSFELGRNSFET